MISHVEISALASEHRGDSIHVLVGSLQRRASTTARTADGPYHDIACLRIDREVRVAPRASQQDPINALDRRPPVRVAGVWLLANSRERRVQLCEECLRNAAVNFDRPAHDCSDMGVCRRRDNDAKRAHPPDRRNSARNSSAGMMRPARTSSSDRTSASCNPARSSFPSPSHASAGSNSTSVPSGRSVGASNTNRPFRTCALSGCMPRITADEAPGTTRDTDYHDGAAHEPRREQAGRGVRRSRQVAR